MTNFNFQGKIIRHFWGKLIRQSTRSVMFYEEVVFIKCYLGGCLIYQNGILGNKITFFHYDIRAG